MNIIAKDDKELKNVDKKDINTILTNRRNIGNKLSQITYGTGNKVDDDTQAGINSVLDTVDELIGVMGDTSGGDVIGNLTKIINTNEDMRIREFNKIREEIEDSSDMSDISAMYSANKYRTEMVSDYELIIKLVPQLRDAIDSLRDNILSPDDFSKEVLNIFYSHEQSLVGSTDPIISKLIKIRDKYKVDKHLIRAVEKTLGLGEHFIAVIPYADIFEKAIDDKNVNKSTTAMSESISIEDIRGVLDKSDVRTRRYAEDMHDAMKNSNISVFSESVGIISESEFEYVKYLRENDLDLGDADFSTKAKKFVNSSKYTKYEDGHYTSNTPGKNAVKVPGCVVKHLDLKKVIPVMVGNLCLGYYYLETEEIEHVVLNYDNPINRFKSYVNSYDKQTSSNQIYSRLADTIVSMIDKKFIEKNVEFKDSIYEFIKYNDTINKNIKVTFIDKKHMHHFKINEDDVGRGVSILENVLFPAKLYISLLISNVMMKITRSADKRAYYIKNSIARDVSQSVSLAIREIKKDQRSIGDIMNTTQMFSTMGKFTDLFIPVSDNDDKPINFDIIAGQDAPLKDDMIEMLEDIMVNGTGIPSALLNYGNEVEFSRMLTMLNGKVLKRTVAYQNELELATTNFVKAILSTEVSSDDELRVVEDLVTKFPVPTTLAISNLNDQFGNVLAHVDNIVNVEMGESGDDKVKEILKRNLIKQKMPNVDWAEISKMREQATLEAKGDAIKNNDSM